MNENYVVSCMDKEELTKVVEWAALEGWNPGLQDVDCFYKADPRGFFCGKLDDKLIAAGSAVIYDDKFAFCGLYIVDSAYRGQGYGLALTKARLAYIGDRNAGIDGVMNMLDKYARLGYRLAYNNARYRGRQFPALDQRDAHITPLSQVDFLQVSQYDRRHFPAARDVFLKTWIDQKGSTSLGYVSGSKLQGFGVIRPCCDGYRIGPLFADNPVIADALFQHLVAETNGQNVFLDLHENNVHAVALAKGYQMEKIFETARMYLKGVPDLRMEGIYGITSLELG